MKSSMPLPDKIGRYQILERVGRGAMGVLYRGHDPVLDREVAVKVMLTDFAEDSEQLRPRFYREAKAVARLQHRNIVTIFEFAEEADQPHIVMEFLRGQPLAERMEAEPPLTLDDKLDIVAQLCSGLAYAHSQGVVHRDVKPANVFLLADGTVKLLDFGIAKLTTSTMTRQGDVLGSASYMSPEQVSGSDSVDGRADVWSTGVLLYELLAGRRPFEGDTPTNVIVKILKEDPEPLDAIVAGLPKQLAALVGRALEKDPDRRVSRAEELGRELQWIRKALQATGDLPPMEETRFASTQVLKALHDERQQPSGRSIGGQPLAAPAAAPVGRSTAPRPPARRVLPPVVTPAPPAPRSMSSILMAILAVTVIVGGAGAAVWLGPWSPGGSRTDPGATGTPATPIPPGPPAPARPDPNPPVPPPAPDPPPKLKVALEPAEKNPPPEKITKPAPPKPPPAVMVAVTMTGAYPFRVMDGSRVVSDTSSSHDFRHANGRMVRIVAPEVFLDQPVRIDGGAERVFDFSAPGLGQIDIRAVRGDCKVLLGKRDLGFLPLPPVRVVPGDYEVSLSCPDGVNPRNATTVTQGFTARVLFR